MKIFIGADHNGFELKKKVIEHLKRSGHEVDEGDKQLTADDDFPVFASRAVSAMLSSAESDPRGILICGSGQGMVIAANRFRGIRAGLGWSKEAAREVRHDEDSNVLALPSQIFKNDKDWQEVVDTWLKTPFAGATRFKRRIQQLDEL